MNAMGEGRASMRSITSLVDDFFTGNTHDGNMGATMNHYADHGSANRAVRKITEAGLSAGATNRAGELP